MKTITTLAALAAFAISSITSAAPVNINTADSDALVEGLTGIGPQKAMAIVRYRQQYGPFQHVDDLAQVDGIGEKTVDQNRANMTVSVPQKSK